MVKPPVEITWQGAIQRAHNDNIRAILGPLLWALAAFYAGLTLYWAVTLRPEVAYLGATWGAASVFLAAIAYFRRFIPATRMVDAAGIAAAITAMAGVGLLHSTEGPGLTFALAITMIAWGVILPSVWWLAATVGLLCLGWSLSAFAAGFDQSWQAQAFLLVPSVLVAFVAQRMRLAQIMRDEQSRLHDIEAARHSAALEALQRQEAFRRAFLRLVAHELRTPMTPVLMDIQTQGGKLPERLTRNLHRLNKVIADVIDITHYESSPSVASQNVDVAALQFPFTTKFTGPVQVQAHAEDCGKPWRG